MVEEELNAVLFEHHSRGIVLTQAGQDVLRHAYRVVGEIQELKASMADQDNALRKLMGSSLEVYSYKFE